jgi:peptidoglycan biosynthesis protein MviN/MurJ (putative lipid II flippase)
MAEGSISVISLSINLQSVPLTIIGVSYSLAAFPTLSRYFIANNLEAFAKQVIATARHIIFWTLPATALFIVLRAHIVRVLLGTGEFDWSDTRLVAAALALFVVSAVFQSLLLLFIRAFYSAGIVYRPLLYSFISLAITVLTAYALVKAFYIYEEFDRFFAILLKVEDLPSTVVLALPLAFSIGVIANGILHWSGFEREFGPRLPVEYRFTRNIIRPAFQSFVTAVIMGVTAYYSLIIFEPTFETASLVGIFLQGFVAGLVAIVVGVIVLHFLGSRELREVSSTIRDQFWKEKVLTTDPEIV